MATTHSNHPLLTEQNQRTTGTRQTQIRDDKALVALGSEHLEAKPPISLGSPVALLPVELDVRFRCATSGSPICSRSSVGS